MIDIKEIKDEDLTNVSGGINSNDEDENLEEALNRFKRNSSREGILAEIRKREHYEKPAIRRKKKAEASRKRKY